MKHFFVPYCLTLFISSGCLSQSKGHLGSMQGIWENSMSGLETEKSFTIVNGKTSLDFVFDFTTKKIDFPMGELLEGFQDYDSGQCNSIHVDSLKSTGAYYTLVNKKYVGKNGNVRRPGYVTPKSFECDGYKMSISEGGELAKYYKVEQLPGDALTMLYLRGKLDRRNYIKDYLNQEVKEVKNHQSIVFSQPRSTPIDSLAKGQLVFVRQTKGNWCKIAFGSKEDVKQGWVRSGDLGH